MNLENDLVVQCEVSILRRMMKSASGWQSRTLRTTSMIHIQDNKLWQELLYSKIKIKEA